MHSIQVILSKEKIITQLESSFENATKLSLNQDFALLTIESKDKIKENLKASVNESKSKFQEFDYLFHSLNKRLLVKSILGEIAYIETNYFGGRGTQAAILYKNQKIEIAPLQSETFWNEERNEIEIIPKRELAINLVLKTLGVKKGNYADEFEALELGEYRSNYKIKKKSRQ